MIEGTANIRKVNEEGLPVLPHFSEKLNANHSKTQTKGSKLLENKCYNKTLNQSFKEALMFKVLITDPISEKGIEILKREPDI
ncbi:MAG: hypothetical protein ACO2PP_00720, partial [Thermocrinis sp.]|uniref:hypothetical protein n=1 Tax=Thermocrinis sp. TaxID=2024383 RepID=UPI003BFFFF9A